MKRKIVLLLVVSAMVMCLAAGCGNTPEEKSDTTEEAVEEQGPEKEEEIEELEETEEADEAEEPEETESAENETTQAETPETAEPTEPAAPTYTYADMSATKYAQCSLNVRDLPGTDGAKLGTLSLNQVVTVTGQCNETGWYRIDYNGGTAYVSNKYLGDNKVEVQAQAPTQTGNTAPTETAQTSESTQSGGECPYPLYQVIDEGGDNVYFYCLWDGVTHVGQNPNFWPCFDACIAIQKERYPERTGGMNSTAEETGYYVDGMQVVKQMPHWLP